MENMFRCFLLVQVCVILLLCSCSEDEQIDGDMDFTDGDSEIESVDGDFSTDGDSEGDAEIDTAPLACREEVSERTLDWQPDETFEMGPYLMSPSPTGITIMWYTLDEADGEVLFGEGDDLNLSATQEGSVKIHEVVLSDLKPNTRYGYKVRSGETTSELHHFYTAVEENQGFNFAVWGDNQNGPDVFRTVVDGIAAEKPYLLVGVGDHTQDGTDFSLWKEQLFGPARGLFHEVALYAAMGNHNYYSENYNDLFAFPYPPDHPEQESTYSFTYGNAFFLVIDTNQIFYPFGAVETDLSTYIREQLDSEAAQQATWRFALGHEPGYAEGWGDGSCHYDGYDPVRGWLLPLLAEKKFHAYFSGHMHGYERGAVDGLVQIITGGGGGGLDAWCKDWPQTSVAHYEHNFLRIEAGCDQLRIEAKYPDGEVFDWIVLDAETYGEVVEQGPVADLPSPTINSDSQETPPTR